MILEKPTIAVIGAGAVGCYYGARLAQHGLDVHFLLRSDYETIRRQGLRVRSCNGDFTLPPERLRVYDDVRRLPPADLVLVTLKTTANAQFASLIPPLLKNESTAILTLQNGLGNEERLADLVGAQRVLGGMCFVCINRVAAGEIDHTAHGLVRIGEFGGGPSQRASQIAALFNAHGVQCQVLDDLRRGRWEKLVWNIPFNGLTTVMDLPTDRLLASAAGEQLIRRIMAEVIAAGRAAGVTLLDELIDQNVRNTREMGSYRTSMQIDREARRPLEIEAILGEPLHTAQRHGVATPILSVLYDQIRIVAGNVSAEMPPT